jgi:hypothetical protein
VAAAAPAVPAAPGAVTAARVRTATLAELQRLLRTPQSLRTAILLQEILAPPLCRREQRRTF